MFGFARKQPDQSTYVAPATVEAGLGGAAPATARPWRVGDSVEVDQFGDGVICDGPEIFGAGRRFRVARCTDPYVGEVAVTDFLETYLKPGPARPTFTVGDRVQAFGHEGKVLEVTEDDALVEFKIYMANGKLQTKRSHRLPHWRMAIIADRIGDDECSS